MSSISALTMINSGLTITSMILTVKFLSKFLIVIIKKFFFINKNNILARGEESPTARILTRFVGVQSQLLRESNLVVYQIASINISRKDHLQSFTRRRHKNQQNTALILIAQFGISLIPDLPHVAFDMIIVYHRQSVQTTELLIAPSATFRRLLTSQLILEHLV